MQTLTQRNKRINIHRNSIKQRKFMDYIPKNNIIFRIILQKVCIIQIKVVPLQRF